MLLRQSFICNYKCDLRDPLHLTQHCEAGGYKLLSHQFVVRVQLRLLYLYDTRSSGSFLPDLLSNESIFMQQKSTPNLQAVPITHGALA